MLALLADSFSLCGTALRVCVISSIDKMTVTITSIGSGNHEFTPVFCFVCHWLEISQAVSVSDM